MTKSATPQPPAGADYPAPGGRGAEQQSIKGMLSDAMAKSKGQGVVQGSTIFFKNLAESVAHSNRNLKIGLAFLTAAFVVVAGSLGFLVFQAFKGQVETRATIDESIRNLDSKTKEVLTPFLTRSKELEDRMNRLDAQLKVDLETYRVNADQRVDAARAEVQQLRAEVAELRQSVERLEKGMGGWKVQLEDGFGQIINRLNALEKAKR